MLRAMLLSTVVFVFASGFLSAQDLDTGPVTARFRMLIAPSGEKYFSDSTKLGFKPGFNEGWEPPCLYHEFSALLDGRNQFSYEGNLRSEEGVGFDGTPSLHRGGMFQCAGKVDFESWTFHLEGHYVKTHAYGKDLKEVAQEESSFFALDGPLAYPAADSAQPRWKLFKLFGSVACAVTFAPEPFRAGGSWNWSFPLETRPGKDDIACQLAWKSPYSRSDSVVAAWEKETGKVWVDDFTQENYRRLKRQGPAR